MISQLRPQYIYVLNMYLKTLEQRNIYLRQIKEKGLNEELLEIWDEKLAEYAEKVYKYRNEFIEKIKEKINKIHHRDDFLVYINGKQVNIYGSQGQNRTVILSLKLTELEIIQEEIGEYPILLLDDFMSELDYKRRENFLKNIMNTQILITCTEKFTIKDKLCTIYEVNKRKC